MIITLVLVVFLFFATIFGIEEPQHFRQPHVVVSLGEDEWVWVSQAVSQQVDSDMEEILSWN